MLQGADAGVDVRPHPTGKRGPSGGGRDRPREPTALRGRELDVVVEKADHDHVRVERQAELLELRQLVEGSPGVFDGNASRRRTASAARQGIEAATSARARLKNRSLTLRGRVGDVALPSRRGLEESVHPGGCAFSTTPLMSVGIAPLDLPYTSGARPYRRT